MSNIPGFIGFKRNQESTLGLRNAINTVPTPSGPNKVGTRVIDLVDSMRSDPYHATGARRELAVRFWYPTAFTRGCKPAPYASSSVWNYLAQLERVPAPRVKTNSCQDAAITLGTHPVVVFTHGYTGTFTDYTFCLKTWPAEDTWWHPWAIPSKRPRLSFPMDGWSSQF